VAIVVVRSALEEDVAPIHATLAANAADSSLFQQPVRRIRRNLRDFVVAVDATSTVLGCAALHWHARDNAEILAVAVAPDAHGKGVGNALMTACIARSAEHGTIFLWLATAKPDYFARYGFQRISKWRLPLRVVFRKLRLIFDQPVRRWLPALFGRHTFMRLGT
jgi:amino-acid N-acetyltransferase